MKILVTGRNGQLARSILQQARGRPGVEIVAIGRPELDLEQPGSAADAVRRVAPDLIINTAAYTAVDQVEDEPERAFRINAAAAGELAWAAQAGGCRMIQVSTDYVFDGRSDEPYRPEHLTGPLNVYGRSKLEGEERVRAELADAIVVRTAWLFSPFGRNFVRTMLQLAQRQEPIMVVADQWGSPTSALELADGLLAVVACWSDVATGLGRVYHLAGAGTASWADLAEIVVGDGRVVPIATAERPGKAARPRYSSLDSSAFEQDFAFAAKPWREPVASVVAALQPRMPGATAAPA